MGGVKIVDGTSGEFLRRERMLYGIVVAVCGESNVADFV